MKIEMAIPNMYFRSDMNGVFELLEKRGGIKDICVNAIIEEFTDEKHGSRFPSMVDKLNRPVDGKDVIYVKNHSTFVPNLDLYCQTEIRPPEGDGQGDILKDAIIAGKQRGFSFSIMDVPMGIPPQKNQNSGILYGYPSWTVIDDEYKGVRIDGKLISGVESKGCPNNDEVRNYMLARIRDIIEHYPEIDAFHIDHLEFPTYTLEDCFSCFCKYCVEKASEFGYDLEKIREDLLPYYNKLEQITAKELDELLSHESFQALAEFRWKSIKERAVEIRKVVNDAGRNQVKFGITGFTPAFSLFGSRNYQEIAGLCDIVLPKFYPEHWTVVLNLWLKKLCANNSMLSEKAALEVIYEHLGWDGKDLPFSSAEIDVDRHCLLPMSLVDVEAKRSIRLIGEKAEIRPTIHGWGSLDNWKEKMRFLSDNKMGCYIWGLFHITDEQMDVIRQTVTNM